MGAASCCLGSFDHFDNSYRAKLKFIYMYIYIIYKKTEMWSRQETKREQIRERMTDRHIYLTPR